jgi:hypothetical protein
MANVDLSTKTVLFIDNGLFISFCRHVAPAFGKAYYHKPFQSAFVRTNDLAPGRGFPEFEWVEQPQEIEHEIDLFVFLDLYQSGWAERLRKQDKRVWGAGRGEEMELFRWEFKEELKRLGLPVQHCEHLFGVEALRKYLKGSSGTKFVKTSYVRGDFETFKADEYKLVEPRLDELAHTLGVKKDKYEFIVEDEIPDAVEIGYDGFVIDGEYPSQCMTAYEIKDCGMIGRVKSYNELNDGVKLVNSKLSPRFKADGYRGFFCSEVRLTKNREPFLIDPCCRLGTPSNELLQELFDGWPEVLWNGAEGVLVSPKPKARFGCLAMIYSEWATNDWLCLHYPRALDDFVKLRFHTRVGDRDYIVPQVIGIPDVGCVVGTGDTLQAAIKSCKERAEQVKGFQVSVKLDALDTAVDTIKEGEKFGIKF